MIDAKALLADLTRLLKRLEDDLRERALSPSSEVPELRGQLQAEWQAARDAERTAETFESWAEQVLTQAGVHWLLSCVFLRFIEDNGLVDRPWISGTPQSGRLALARDNHDAYFRAHPHQNDRDFLIASFREASALPGLRTFFDEAHNPVFRLGISGDAAMAVIQFWQEIGADSGLLVRDFTDAAWNTRFLGDLYQELSEATRKRYALLQTPEFVEEFILDRTLTPAIQEFGYREVRLIDPTCGSGHFLLGAFHRLVAEWARNEPGRNPTDVAQKSLDAVAGVDLNPFAVAIARFRLLLAALQVSRVQRLANALDFKMNVAIGDSLLHGTRFGMTETEHLFDAAETHRETGLKHAYASEDLDAIQRILGRQYHAVVGNPPYIVVKDAVLNWAYRQKYASCHKKYSLGCPFTERFFELATSAREQYASAGFVGLITTNAFMKRDYGERLVELVLPRLDLTHIVDTAKAHIPGHGTPTVILFGRNRPPVSGKVRMVIGRRAEAEKPKAAAEGLVWAAIKEQIDRPESNSSFVTSADVERSTLANHPWSLGTQEVIALKERIGVAGRTLGSAVGVIGVFGMTNADDALLATKEALLRRGVEVTAMRPLVVAEQVRDWQVAEGESAIFPYADERIIELNDLPGMGRWLWPCRTVMGNRATFSKKTYFEEGRPWWGWHQVALDRLRPRRTITLAFLSTNNQFALIDTDCVFGRTAPIIKLHEDATEGTYYGLLGVLNSSTVSFWLKQTLMDRGGGGIGGGLATEAWERFYEHDSGKLEGIPLPHVLPEKLSAAICSLFAEIDDLMPARQIEVALRRGQVSGADIRALLKEAQDRVRRLLQEAIALQEELDWCSYGLYGLLTPEQGAHCTSSESLPAVDIGCRAFEIALARRMAAGLEDTTWFERHGATPTLEIPSHWPEHYREVVSRRIELIERDAGIGLIERPEFKRRWNSPKWEDLEQSALRDWLLGRLETPALWPASVHQQPQLTSVHRLADAVQRDADFMQVAALYAGRSDFQLPQLVSDLVTAESVPFLPVLRYTDSGLRKREQWEATWALQRHEDRIDAEVEAEAPGWREKLQSQAAKGFGNATTPDAAAWVEDQLAKEIAQQKVERKENEVGKFPVPPKYQSKDFLKADVWRLRGGLDVPKERWVSYPGCERGADGSLPIAWAGWDHLQQAMALASYFIDMKEREGWSPERLQPLLAGLLELLPWLKQWHDEMNPDFGARMGDYYESFVNDEARALQFTLDNLRAWKPAAQPARRGRRRTT
ncbi:MAG: BREX-2 system adenine-specific DNA-methyltransferase PglX [Pseudomonadota bacterium]